MNLRALKRINIKVLHNSNGNLSPYSENSAVEFKELIDTLSGTAKFKTWRRNLYSQTKSAISITVNNSCLLSGF
jgi:hypothetical protein